jgi:hypothetical protein
VNTRKRKPNCKEQRRAIKRSSLINSDSHMHVERPSTEKYSSD